MNAWTIAALVLMLGGLIPLAIAGLARDTMSAAASLNLGGPLTSLILLLLAEGFHRQSFIDLAVILAVMAFIGSVILVRFLEWEV